MIVSIKDIESVLIKEDIEGLLELGAPIDEYLDEAKKISEGMSRLNTLQASEEVIYILIRDIWQDSFGPFSDSELRKRDTAFRNVVRYIIEQKNY